MKILLLVTGDIRDTSNFEHNINTHLNMLKGYDVHTMIVTWHSSDKECIFYERNFYRKYSVNKVFTYNVDSVFLVPNIEIENIHRTRNGHPPMFINMMKFITNSKIIRDMDFDYVIRMRNNLTVKFPNIDEYFLHDTIFVPPQLWFPDKIGLNDWYFICHKNMLMKMRDMNVNDIVSRSWSTEIAHNYMLKLATDNIKVIKNIETYILNNTWELIKDFKFLGDTYRINYEQTYKSPYYFI